MSYTLSVSGHAESKEGEAKVLEAAADFADTAGANGSFSFQGMHFHVQAAPAADGVAAARAAVAAYNEGADADDKVDAG
jgi:hypothetical protein